MSSGWIALHRKIRDSYIWDLPGSQRLVAIEIFLGANWEDRTWVTHDESVDIPRGEMVTSVRQLAARAGVSEGCARRALKALERGETVKIRATHQRTHITVLNYAQYQDLDEVGRRTNGSANGCANGSTNGIQKNKRTKNKEPREGEAQHNPQPTLPLDAGTQATTPSPSPSPDVVALWAYQEELRKAAVPRSRALPLTADRAKAVAARLAERPAESAVGDARHVLEVYAADARRNAESRRWFNGETNWVAANFARALGQPAPGPGGSSSGGLML